jgi:DNA-binding CsgD family transcriptional regulator
MTPSTGDATNGADALEAGRSSFEAEAWGDAHALLTAADQRSPLEIEDLERLAQAAALVGRESESDDLWTRAHQECLRLEDPVRAARCAFWLGMRLMNSGEMARGGGWLARAHGLLEGEPRDCPEKGFLLLPRALQTLAQGDAETAVGIFARAAEIGDRFREHDLMTLGRLGQGQALVRLRRTDLGVALLDEVMVAVSAGETSPTVTGIAYCAAIEACEEILDLRRAQEWTAALSHWCSSHPELVPFRGQCLVHRAALMQLHGNWTEALDEAERARELLFGHAGHSAVGSAFYQMGELHRLRGDFEEAEEGYRQANEFGRAPQPGLAQLRLAQGRVDAAETTIRLALEETQDRILRSRLLAAQVDILLAANDTDVARSAAKELREIAEESDAPLLDAMAERAEGATLLAGGDAPAAIRVLRRAHSAWRGLEAPYEVAQIRVLLGLACRALGDEDSAEMEFEGASRAFSQLGAAPGLALIEEVRGTREIAGGLTGREVEVLGQVATGKTNRDIAAELVISEKTVARHLSNIFTKLGVSSRAAATAYAYKHDLA